MNKLHTKLITYFILCYFFLGCSSPIKNTSLFNTYQDYSLEKLDLALAEDGYKPIESERVLKLLETTQKKTRAQAIKNIKETESFQEWTYMQSSDSLSAWISYLAPKYVILSKKLVHTIDTTTTLDITPVLYHYWSHYEMSHFRKRSESMLATDFGGLTLRSAIDFNYNKTIHQLLAINGALFSGKPIYMFSLNEEADSEWLTRKAFLMGRKDSTQIIDVWNTINPDYDWAEDFLKIHFGKIKLAN